MKAIIELVKEIEAEEARLQRLLEDSKMTLFDLGKAHGNIEATTKRLGDTAILRNISEEAFKAFQQKLEIAVEENRFAESEDKHEAAMFLFYKLEKEAGEVARHERSPQEIEQGLMV